MKSISYSQYSIWANCGHAWKLRYVDGHKFDDTSIHTIFGTACHEIIQSWLDTLYNKSESVAKTVYLHDDFKSRLIELFKKHTVLHENGEKTFLCDKKTLMEFYEQGCQILTYVQNNYKKLFPTKNTRLFAVEYKLDAVVKNGVHYVGYIDIVTHNTEDDTYILYDLKTSKKGWSAADKANPVKIGQLLLYKKFFSDQMNIPEENISVEFIVLKRIIFENSQYVIPRVMKFEPPNKKPSLKKNWQRFSEFVDACFDDNGEYIVEQVANPSAANCRWCVYRDKKELCSVGILK